MAGFDPNQPRDETGRWTDTGVVPIGAKDYTYYKNALSNKSLQDPSDKRLLSEFEHMQDTFVESYGQQPDQYAAEIEEYYRQQLEQSNVYMRITEDNLEKALNDGEFKNTFMTGKTAVVPEKNEQIYAGYVNRRIQIENQALGIPKNTPAENRPVYGYWSQDLYGFGKDKYAVVSDYGDIIIQFDKDKLGKNLTFTGTDSLDYSDYIRSSFPSDPSLFSIDHWWRKGDHTSSPSGKYRDRPESDMYWEAQIFDRSLSNVKKIIFTGGAGRVSRNLLRKLDEKGIPWEVLDT